MNYHKTRNLLGNYVFVFPALVLFTVFSLYPLFEVFHLSITDWDGIALVKNYVGMENFHDQQQERVIELINAYRTLGHLQAVTDPLKMAQPIYNPTLELAYYGFTDQDLKKVFKNCGNNIEEISFNL